MKTIFIVQSGFQDGPEVFTTPKKAYDFIIRSCNGIADSIPPYRRVLKEIKGNIKLGNVIGWALDVWDDDSAVGITIKELNPEY